MKTRNVTLAALAVLSMVVTGCTKTTSTATSTATSTSAAAPAQKDYAGYSIDLNNDGTIADDEKNLTWANSYDKAIAAIKASGDATFRYAMMHKVETLLMSTGAITPIYYYTDLYMLRSTVQGFYYSPLGYKFFKNASVTGDTSKSITVCLASEPQHVDPALNSSVDGASLDVHLFGGLYRYVDSGINNLAKIEPDLAAAAPTKVTNADGSVTYTSTLRDGITFSDGTPIVASDFVKSWKRAGGTALGADYAYMFDILQRDANGEVSGVEAIDDTHLKVTCPIEVPYFFEIMAFPAFEVIKNADDTTKVDATGSWAMDPNFVTSGAYTISSWTHSGQIVMTKNDKYWDAANTTMNTINFALSDDTDNMFANYENGTYQMIDDVPLDNLDTLKTRADFHINGQLGTYYISFNVNSKAFTKADTEPKREKVRRALGLFIDRNNIVNNVSKGGQTPANSFVPTGLTDADGTTEFTAHNGENGDGKGYYSVAAADYAANVAEGVQLLKDVGYTYDTATKKFTDFPAFTYLYNTSSGHQKIATAIQADWAAVGITANLENQEWATFLQTRKTGDYDVARNGWLADYNDPITFLDMWTTDSGNNDCQFGK